MFTNRKKAGQLLAAKCLKFHHAPIVTISPGGAVVAKEMTRLLSSSLDFFVIQQIGNPGARNLPVALVDEEGAVQYLDSEASERQDWFSTARVSTQHAAASLGKKYRNGRNALEVHGKPVLIVEDGIDDVRPVRMAIAAARRAGASVVALASPVISETAYSALKKEADEVLYVELYNDSFGISVHYAEYPEVSKDALMKILKTSHS
ncbi:MAG: hypothetical protein RIQ56_692 [Candidatus Parcubacteria bacterium]|jgi:predicted phosphoribosyltransferase